MKGTNIFLGSVYPTILFPDLPNDLSGVNIHTLTFRHIGYLWILILIHRNSHRHIKVVKKEKTFDEGTGREGGRRSRTPTRESPGQR